MRSRAAEGWRAIGARLPLHVAELEICRGFALLFGLTSGRLWSSGSLVFPYADLSKTHSQSRW